MAIPKQCALVRLICGKALVVVEAVPAVMMITAEVVPIGIAETITGAVGETVTTMTELVDGVVNETAIERTIDITIAATEGTAAAVVVDGMRMIGGGAIDTNATMEGGADMSAVARVAVIDMEVVESAVLRGPVSQTQRMRLLLPVPMIPLLGRKRRSGEKLPRNWQPFRKRRKS